MIEVPFPKNPYVGPRSFQKSERLYGRERELHTLFYMLSADRVVLFCSPSGAGKTSLIQAQLINKLESEGFNVLPIMRVGADPVADLQAAQTNVQPVGNRYIVSALQSLEVALAPAQRVASDKLGRLTFSNYLRQRPGALDDYSREVLIFDQFEEILTVDPNDRPDKESFFAEVGEALYNHRRWALFVIREEYVGALEPYAHFIPGDFGSRFRLDLLDVGAAQAAIRQPARDVGIDFTNEAAAHLADNLRTIRFERPDGTIERQLGAYIEPVQLQVVCLQLWDALAQHRREELSRQLLVRMLMQPIDGVDLPGQLSEQPVDGAEIPRQLLAQLIEQPVDGADLSLIGASMQTIPLTGRIDVADLREIVNVDQALSRYYAEQICAVVATGVRERFLRDWIGRWLITSEGLRSQVQRRSGETEKLPDQALALLIDAHLVREERRLGGKWCELTHDRLIKPIRDSNKEWQERHRHSLQTQAEIWMLQGESKGILLRDDALDKAISWSRANAADLTQDERRFIQASQEAQQQAEQLRQEQIREQQNARRIRMLGFTVGAMGVVSIVLAILVFLNQQEIIDIKQENINLMKVLDVTRDERDAANSRIDTVRIQAIPGNRTAMAIVAEAQQTVAAADTTIKQIRTALAQQPTQTKEATTPSANTPSSPTNPIQADTPTTAVATATATTAVETATATATTAVETATATATTAVETATATAVETATATATAVETATATAVETATMP